MNKRALNVTSELAQMASDNHGMVTIAAAKGAGISRESLTDRVRLGILKPVESNVWLFGSGDADFEQQCRAAVWSSGGVLGGVAALVWHGVIAKAHDSLLPTVLIRSGKRCQMRNAKVIRTNRLENSDFAKVRGLPVSTVPRALLDASAELTRSEVERCLDDALLQKQTAMKQLQRQIDLAAGTGGVELLRSLIDERSPLGGKPLTRSRAEQRIKETLGTFPGPQPCFQFVIRTVNGHRFEVDLAWPQYRRIIEIDGFRWHGGRKDWKRDIDRDTELTISGWTVHRITPEIDPETLHQLIFSLLQLCSSQAA
jgi:hypothetical protein